MLCRVANTPRTKKEKVSDHIYKIPRIRRLTTAIRFGIVISMPPKPGYSPHEHNKIGDDVGSGDAVTKETVIEAIAIRN